MDNPSFKDEDNGNLKHELNNKPVTHAHVVDEDAVSNQSSDEGVHLKKKFGLFGGIGLIVGGIIGSGIFISPTGVLVNSGSVGLSLIVWFVGAVGALLTALIYLELGMSIKASGADYAYLYECYGSFVAFMFSWCRMFVTIPSSQAVLSLTCARYALGMAFDDCGPPKIAEKLFAMAIIILVCIVNCYSVKLTSKMVSLFTIGKISALIIVIIGGVYYLSKGETDYLSPSALFQGSSTDPSRIVLAYYAAGFAYGGWDRLALVFEELKNPVKNLPRATIASISIVTIIYLLVVTSYHAVLSTEEMLSANAVALSWSKYVLGTFMFLIPLGVTVSTFGSLGSSGMSHSRLFFVVARNDQLMSFLAMIQVRRYTPLPALLFMTTFSLVMIVWSDIFQLINSLSFLEMFFRVLISASVLILRYTRKDLARPFKVNVVIPVFMVLMYAALVILPVYKNPKIEFLYSAAFAASGIFIYFPFVYFKLKTPFMDHVTTALQLFFEVTPTDYDKQQ